MGARTRSKMDTLHWRQRVTRDGLLGAGILGGTVMSLATITFNDQDPSWNVSGSDKTTNWLGEPGANLADFVLQLLGIAIIPALLALIGFCFLALLRGPGGVPRLRLRAWLAALGVVMFAAAVSGLPHAPSWPMRTGLGGLIGDCILHILAMPFAGAQSGEGFGAVIAFAIALACGAVAMQLKRTDLDAAIDAATYGWASLRVAADDVMARFGGSKAPVRKTASSARKKAERPVATRDIDPHDVA
ncbi:DNA translocase FtsK 4TM domain-containing protein, partial [Aquidulcibacter sp.]|uniref:DNA translocase FtsK 4TM domain-containing protein n=1 Tax=Aquidulcibacter sp. TaxID=2052990 RepID=UPI0025B88450